MAIPKVGQKLTFKRGQSRLFDSVWLIVHLTDSLSSVGLAFKGQLDKIDKSFAKPVFYDVSNTFRRAIALPIIKPMKSTIQNNPIDVIDLEITDAMVFAAPLETSQTINEFGQLHNKLISMVYLQFYEQYRPYVQNKYGTDTKKWPPIFQFAWAIRNGIVHHDGNINFTNQNYPAVRWQTFSYSPADNGNPLFDGKKFATAELIFLLFDLSDHLDALGAPVLS